MQNKRNNWVPVPPSVIEFLDHLHTELNKSPRTAEAYCGDLLQFTAYLDGRALEGASEDDVRGFLARVAANGAAPATVARKYNALQSYFLHLLRKRAIGFNPMRDLDRPPCARPTAPLLTEAEAHGLITAPGLALRDQAILRLLYAGLKVSEAIALDLRDVDLANGLVTITAEAGRSRRVAVSWETVKALDTYLQQERNGRRTVALFLNYAGRRISRQCVWKAVKTAARSAGVGLAVSPETLRQSCAQHLWARGVALSTIQELLGHADVSSTRLYARAPHTRGVAA